MPATKLGKVNTFAPEASGAGMKMLAKTPVTKAAPKKSKFKKEASFHKSLKEPIKIRTLCKLKPDSIATF